MFPVCDWQSSLYFADVYSYREATWHIVNYTCNLSQFISSFFLDLPDFSCDHGLVIFSWEPQECVCVRACVCLRVYDCLWGCVCVCVWFKRRLLVYATVGSPHCVSARIGLADCVCGRLEMWPTPTRKKDSVVPLWIHWTGLIYSFVHI